MPKRKVWTHTKTGQNFYKVNVQFLIDSDMVSELSEISGRSEKFIIDQIIATYTQNGELGLGFGSDNQMHIYIDEDDNYPRTTSDDELEEGREYLDIKDDVTFNLTTTVFAQG